MATSLSTFHSPAKMLDWQYREIIAELQELQRHAADPSCPCVQANTGEYCLMKHALGVHTLAGETASMDPRNAKMLELLAEEALKQHQALKDRVVCGKPHREEKETVEWARQWRKKLEAIYYSCKINLKQDLQIIPYMDLQYHIDEALLAQSKPVTISGKCTDAKGCSFKVKKTATTGAKACSVDELVKSVDAVTRTSCICKPEKVTPCGGITQVVRTAPRKEKVDWDTQDGEGQIMAHEADVGEPWIAAMKAITYGGKSVESIKRELRSHFNGRGNHLIRGRTALAKAETREEIIQAIESVRPKRISPAILSMSKVQWAEVLKRQLPMSFEVKPAPIIEPPLEAQSKYKLFPFQAEGVRWLKTRSFALLADEMGLGKTPQAIHWAAELRPALVIVPAALVLNWQREIKEMWRPDDTVLVLDGKERLPLNVPDWTIMSYGMLERYLGSLKRAGYRSIIIDEAHQVKNLDAQRTQNILELVEPKILQETAREPIPNRLAVTGTPILNRPIELFPLFVFLGVKRRSDYRSFMETYTESRRIMGRVVFTGAKNLADLHIHLKAFMLRRKKSVVLKDLPPKIHTPMFVPISNAAEYHRVERDFLGWVHEKFGPAAAERASSAELITRMNALRQLAAIGKVEPVADWLKPCQDGHGKVLVFSNFKEPLEKLARLKPGQSHIYTGELNKEERQRIVDTFQKTGAACYFLGTVGAAGVGITLTAANRVAFLDLPWTPGGKLQAEDRAHRIGQTQTVEVVSVLAKNTIDERMLKLLAEKEAIINQAIDGKTKDQAMNESLANDLLRSYLGTRLADLKAPPQYVPDEADPDVDQVEIAEGPSGVRLAQAAKGATCDSGYFRARQELTKRTFVVPCTFRGKRTTCQIAPPEQARMFQSTILVAGPLKLERFKGGPYFLRRGGYLYRADASGLSGSPLIMYRDGRWVSYHTDEPVALSESDKRTLGDALNQVNQAKCSMKPTQARMLQPKPVGCKISSFYIPRYDERWDKRRFDFAYRFFCRINKRQDMGKDLYPSNAAWIAFAGGSKDVREFNHKWYTIYETRISQAQGFLDRLWAEWEGGGYKEVGQARIFQPCTLAQDVAITGKCIEGACKIRASKTAAVDVPEIAKIPEAVEKLKTQGQKGGPYTAKTEPVIIDIGGKTFNLSAATAKAMVATVHSTTQRERAFKLCYDPSNPAKMIQPGVECLGTGCSVDPEKYSRCPAEARYQIGTFHTHPLHDPKERPPEATIIPSGRDILHSRGDIECVGSPNIDRIACWTRKAVRTGPPMEGPKRSWGYLKASLPPSFTEPIKKWDSSHPRSRYICKNVEHNLNVVEIPLKELGDDRTSFTPRQTQMPQGTQARLSQEVKIKGKCQDKDTCQFKVVGGELTDGQAQSVDDLPAAIELVRQDIRRHRGPQVTDKTFAIGPSRRRYEFRHRIVDAKDVIVSHDPFTFEKNPAYPESLQPRRRERAAQQLQVRRIASELDPEVLLLDFRSLEKGSPIVGADNIVECGNGRVIALRIAARDYPANAELYKMAVKEAAAGFGLEIPARMELPVLVRERVTPLATMSERKAFAEECNASTTIQASAVEKARTDAPNISLEMLNTLEIGETESINAALQSGRNKHFVVSFLSKLPQEEQAQLVDKAGVISAEGIRRIVLAMFVRAFPGEVGLQLAEQFFEQTEGDILNIANGIVRALGSLAKSEAMTAKGERYQSLSIGADLAKTVSVMAAINRTPGMDVVSYIAQGQLGERELTPFQERILVDLHSLRRSGKRVSDVLKLYAEKVIGSTPPSQGGMFGGVEPSREAYWSAAMNEIRAIEEAEKAERARKRQAGQLVEMSQKPAWFVIPRNQSKRVIDKAVELGLIRDTNDYRYKGQYDLEYGISTDKRICPKQIYSFLFRLYPATGEVVVGKPELRCIPGELRAKVGDFYAWAKQLQTGSLSCPGLACLMQKQPWEITRAEYMRQDAISRRARGHLPEALIAHNAHERAVQQAIYDGKPVPAEVLADYRDLTPRFEIGDLVQIKDHPEWQGRIRNIAGASVTMVDPQDNVFHRQAPDFVLITREKRQHDCGRPVQARLFQSYTYLVKKLDKCNLDSKEAEKALAYKPLREMATHAISTKAQTKLCRAGFVPGTYQFSAFYGMSGTATNPDVQKLLRLASVPNIKRVHSSIQGDYVFQVTVPEMKCTVEDLLGSKQFIPELVVRGEKGEQAKMFKPRCVRTPHGTVGRVVEIQGGGRTRKSYRLDIPGMGVHWVHGRVYDVPCPPTVQLKSIALTDCERRNGLGGALERCVLKVKEKPGVKNPFAICRAVISKPVCGSKVR